jgi:hypothetical protein
MRLQNGKVCRLARMLRTQEAVRILASIAREEKHPPAARLGMRDPARTRLGQAVTGGQKGR